MNLCPPCQSLVSIKKHITRCDILFSLFHTLFSYGTTILRSSKYLLIEMIIFILASRISCCILTPIFFFLSFPENMLFHILQGLKSLPLLPALMSQFEGHYVYPLNAKIQQSWLKNVSNAWKNAVQESFVNWPVPHLNICFKTLSLIV